MIYNQNNYLFTNYHIVSEKIKNIEIEIWNQNIIPLNLNNRYMKCIYKKDDVNIDITAILFEPNEINDIEYLQYDLNFLRGYNDYLNNDVICEGYSDGDELAVQAGKIKEIINKSEFYHNVGTEKGSSGSPITLFESLLVIGIHKAGEEKKD